MRIRLYVSHVPQNSFKHFVDGRSQPQRCCREGARGGVADVREPKLHLLWRWERDVGSLYDKTAKKVLPLRRVDVDRQSASGVTLQSPVRYTPTFVVVDQGREIGRTRDLPATTHSGGGSTNSQRNHRNCA